MSEHDFMATAFVRSVSALKDVSVRYFGDGLEIGFKAYQGFMPNVLQGVAAVLDIVVDDGPRAIRGTLETLKHVAPRGVWYRYRFVPELPHELFFVLDYDHLWSNVCRVRIESPHGSHKLDNLFYREPFIAVPV